MNLRKNDYAQLILFWWILTAFIVVLCIGAICFGTEVRLNCQGKSVYDGDTFFVEVPTMYLRLPSGIYIDGVEEKATEIKPFLIKVRLVDNHLKGRTRPASAPEIRTPSGRAERGALQARDRLKELVEGQDGVIIVNLDMMKTQKGDSYNLARLLTLDRVLADFQAYDKKSTAGETLFREHLVTEWSKKRVAMDPPIKDPPNGVTEAKLVETISDFVKTHGDESDKSLSIGLIDAAQEFDCYKEYQKFLEIINTDTER